MLYGCNYYYLIVVKKEASSGRIFLRASYYSSGSKNLKKTN